MKRKQGSRFSRCLSSFEGSFSETCYLRSKATPNPQSSTLQSRHGRAMFACPYVSSVSQQSYATSDECLVFRLPFMHSTLHRQFVSNNALVMVPQAAAGWHSQKCSRVYLPQCSTTSQISRQVRLW